MRGLTERTAQMSASELGMSLEKIRRFTREAFPIYEHIGLEILDSEPPIGRCRVDLGVATSNHIGTVHAGVQWMVAELVGGVIAMRNFDTRRYVPVVRSVDIAFKRRALGAVTAEGSVSEDEIRRIQTALDEDGRADFEVEIAITTDAGPVARASGRYHLRENEA